MIALYPYQPRSFLTVLGSLAAVRRLKQRGFPENLRNWRFVTLTIDRDEYPDPAEAYEVGNRHLRQFIYELRQRYAIERWCWKLEFHSPDERTGEIYPHWHLLFDYKRPIPCGDISEAWGKGRTEIRGVRDSGFNYLFKYIGKGAASLPDWILTRFRIRLFQTSKGFLPVDCAARDIERPSPRPAADPSDILQTRIPNTGAVGAARSGPSPTASATHAIPGRNFAVATSSSTFAFSGTASAIGAAPTGMAGRIGSRPTAWALRSAWAQLIKTASPAPLRANPPIKPGS